MQRRQSLSSVPRPIAFRSLPHIHFLFPVSHLMNALGFSISRRRKRLFCSLSSLPLMHLPPSTSFPSFFIDFTSLNTLFGCSLSFLGSRPAAFFIDFATIFFARFFMFLYLALLGSVPLLQSPFAHPSFLLSLPSRSRSTTMCSLDLSFLSSSHILHHMPLTPLT